MSTQILPPAPHAPRFVRSPKPLPTAARVRELLACDPETGVFTRRVSNSNCVRVGRVTGYLDKATGYVQISIDRTLCKAHRIAWVHVHGVWPAAQIDHVNGVKSDNRIENLREATNAENHQNLHRAPSNNRSCGVIGVSWHNQRGKWRAHITIGGRMKSLGLFSTVAAARAARAAAEAELFPFSTRGEREAKI